MDTALVDASASSRRVNAAAGVKHLQHDKVNSLRKSEFLSSPSFLSAASVTTKVKHKASHHQTGYLMKISSCKLISPKEEEVISYDSFHENPQRSCHISQRIYHTPLMMCLLLIQMILISHVFASPATSSGTNHNGLTAFNNNVTNFSGHELLYSIVYTFKTFNKSINFTHLAYDPQTDRVYGGASNWLYQFNSSLNIEESVQTGPVDDSPACSPTDCSGVDVMRTNNVNKVLVIDKQSNKLIACGSVHQGSCRRHLLDNISQMEELIPLPVAANDENSSTYAFIGPTRFTGSQLTPVLYVATTNSRLGPYRDMIPAICSRSLEPNRLFNIIEKSFSDTARVDISYHMRDYYLVNYVFGFSANEFVYFATVQKKSHLRTLEEWGYVTRLARVCISDAAYNTYTEVTVQCLGPDGTDYTLLQDAVILKPGNELARQLRIDYNEKVLIGVFATSKDHTSRPSRQSAMCIFPLSEIENKFTENMHLCYNGSVLTRDMDYIAGSIQSCPEPGVSGLSNQIF